MVIVMFFLVTISKTVYMNIKGHSEQYYVLISIKHCHQKWGDKYTYDVSKQISEIDYVT